MSAAVIDILECSGKGVLRMPTITDKATAKLFTNRWVIPLIVLLVAFILAMAGLFAYAAQQRANFQAQLGLVGDEQVMVERMTATALQAAQGEAEAFGRLDQLHQRFAANLGQLSGERGGDVPPVGKGAQADLQQVRQSWQSFEAEVETIVAARDQVDAVATYAETVETYLPELMATYEKVVRALVQSGADSEQIFIASRQLTLVERMQNTLGEILRADENAGASADQFSRDAALFGRVLEGMLEGDEMLGLQPVQNPAIREALRDAAVLFSSVNENIQGLLDGANDVLRASEAALAVGDQAPALAEQITGLEQTLRDLSVQVNRYTLPAYAFGAAALVVLLMLGFILIQDSRRRLQVTEAQNERNQQAILTLLDEMMNLADGDLTTHATVTEDITGAIADSVNYSIDALRELVTTINHTAERVADSTEESQGTSLRLAQSSQKQADEITGTTKAISRMADSMEGISQEADEAAQVANSSVETAHRGGEHVRETIDGMNSVREQIQDTSKRIKRLGESSQEIGDIVGLITDIADQTNILALNAAIQASMAGEAGRGFAVVADEVQRLAERVGNATKQIEGLVKTIQSDTNEASRSMEKTTEGVVTGARLAENAGDTLGEIESLSSTLAGRIQRMSDSAGEQREAAVELRDEMNRIREHTTDTAEQTTQASERIGQLTDLANELRTSVAGFKLPDPVEEEPPVELDAPEETDRPVDAG